MVRAPGGLTPEAWAALRTARTPTVWLWTDRLRRADVPRLLDSRCSHLGLEVAPHGLAKGSADARLWVAPLRRLTRHAGERLRLRFAVRGQAPRADLEALAALASALGAEGVDILPAPA